MTQELGHHANSKWTKKDYNYFKNFQCKEKELVQLLCDKFIHVFVYCFLCCAYWELLLHWTSSIIVDLSLSRPILRESTQIDYSSYTCRTHSDIWPLRILISGWLWNTCAVNQRDSSSSLHQYYIGSGWLGERSRGTKSGADSNGNIALHSRPLTEGAGGFVNLYCRLCTAVLALNCSVCNVLSNYYLDFIQTLRFCIICLCVYSIIYALFVRLISIINKQNLIFY